MPDIIALLGLIGKIDAPWAQYLTGGFAGLAILVSLRGYLKRQDQQVGPEIQPITVEASQEILDEIRAVKAIVERWDQAWR